MALQIRNNIMSALEKIETEWREIRAQKNYSHANFMEWRVRRIRTIEALKRFQEEFDKIHRYSNAGQAVGDGAAVLGGLAMAAGFLMSLSKDWKPFGQELMDYGSKIGTVGGTVSLSSSLAECGFNMRVFNDVKEALEMDEWQTERLLGLFQSTKQLDTYLKDVFGCGVLKVGDVFKAFLELSVIQSEGGKALKNVQSYLLKLIANEFSAGSLPHLDDEKLEKIIRNASYKLKQLFLEFCYNSKVRRAIQKICNSFMENPVLLDMCKISMRIIAMVAVQNIAFTSSLSSFDDKIVMQFVGATAQGVLRAINVALRLCVFFKTVDAFKNGKSKYSEMVEETRHYLRVELETLDDHFLKREKMLNNNTACL